MRSLRKSLALLLALAMVLSAFAITTVSAQTFSDSSGHWADTWINKWSDKNVINGYEDGTFRPDNFITRAELAKIISTAKSYTALAEIAFTDVAGDEWYAADLKKCVAQGVIGGYEDGTFRPDEFITREEASAMFVRAYNINAIGMLNFVDNNDISEWSKTAVTALVGAGVINGYEDGTFLPKATITRAEVVKILDGVDSVVAAFPQATGSTGGTNTVSTIGNLGNSGGSSGSGSGSGQTTPNYKVTFDANGGKFSDGSNTDYLNVGRNGVIGSKAPQPVREGMIFDGWYTSAEAANGLVASKKWSINAVITRNMTLYAGWYVEGKIIVSFETCGGEPDVDSQAIERGSYATKPNVTLSREHYTFMGWYTEANGGKEVDFESTPINVDTCFYARWNVDAEYADQEVIIPSETIGSYQNGKIQAIPSSALPGETVTLNIIPPTEYNVDWSRTTISYTSTKETVPVLDENGKPVLDKDGNQMMEPKVQVLDVSGVEDEVNSYSFVMPNDVEAGTFNVNAQYIEMPPPTATPAPPTPLPPTPDPTKDPNAPTPDPTATPEPVDMPTYYFSSPDFANISEIAANATVGGITVSKKSTISASNKKFTADDEHPDNSGYSYTTVLKIGTAVLSFDVTGSCKITIDAVSASGSTAAEDREYAVMVGNNEIGRYTCLYGQTNSYVVNYSGSGDTIKIQPAKGINVYGIKVEYTGTPEPGPSATSPAGVTTPEPTEIPNPTEIPMPTTDPNIQYGIIADNSDANGTVVVSNGTSSSENLTSSIWDMADSIPADVVEGESGTIIFEKEQDVYINGSDIADGKITFYDNMIYETVVNPDGETIAYVRGIEKAGATPPFNDTNQPSGDMFKIYASSDGYLKIDAYLFTGKEFYLYDEANDKMLYGSLDGYASPVYGNFVSPAADIYTFYIKCEANGNYYFWGGGSTRIGLKSVTAFEAIEAKANTTVTITTKPAQGYKTVALKIEPEVEITETAENTYTFDMPASMVMVSASFANADAEEYTVKAAESENGTVTFENSSTGATGDAELKVFDGQKVKVNAVPNSGFEVASIAAADESDNPIDVDDSTNEFVMPKSNVTVTVIFQKKQVVLPDPNMVAITEDYTFIADNFHKDADDLTNKGCLDENRVYFTGDNKYSIKNKSEIDGVAYYNCMRIKGTKPVIAFMPAFDAEVTFYSDGGTTNSRFVGAGSEPGSYDIALSEPGATVFTFTVQANQLVYITGLNHSASDPSKPDTSGGDVYFAGFTVKHK